MIGKENRASLIRGSQKNVVGVRLRLNLFVLLNFFRTSDQKVAAASCLGFPVRKPASRCWPPPAQSFPGSHSWPSRLRRKGSNFFNGPFQALLFSFSWYIVRLQFICFTVVNDDRKPDTQWEYIDSNSKLKKAKVHPGIWTRPAQTECHRPTTCVTTTARTLICLSSYAALPSFFSRSCLLVLSCFIFFIADSTIVFHLVNNRSR